MILKFGLTRFFYWNFLYKSVKATCYVECGQQRCKCTWMDRVSFEEDIMNWWLTFRREILLYKC